MLHYEVHGTGSQPLILLHGFGTSLETWRDVQPLLEKDFRLYLVDLKGFGRSLKEDGRYAIPDQATAVREFIEEQKLDRVILGGNSFGGGVSLAVAQESDRVAALVLIGSASYRQKVPAFIKILTTPILNQLFLKALPAELRVKYVLKLAFFDESRIEDERVRRHAATVDLPGSHCACIIAAKQAIPDDMDGFVEKIKTIDVPTLIIWGDHDRIVPVEFASRLHADIRHSEMHIIKNCGHIPQEECPRETASLVRAFGKRSVF